MGSHGEFEQFLVQKCKLIREQTGNLQALPPKLVGGVSFHFIKPGHFYISEQLYDEFIEQYISAVKDSNVYSLAEKIPRTCPFYLDLDFKNKVPERQYTETFVNSILSEVWELFKKYLKVESLAKEQTYAWVFEKECPVEDASKTNRIYKDGIHILFPHVIVNDFVFQKIMNELTQLVEEKEYVTWNDELKVSQIFDMKVKAWILYGSIKPGNKPYVLTKHYCPNQHKFMKPNVPIDEIIRTCSLLYKELHEIEYSDDIQEVLTELQEVSQADESTQDDNDSESHYSPISEDEARMLIDMFSEERASDYESWLNVGLCLKSINPDWFHLWEYFSEKSSKVNDKGNKKFMQDNWRKFKDLDKWHVGSLKYWAKTDSPGEYKEVAHKLLDDLLQSSLSCTHNTVAKVVHEILKDDFVCSDPKLEIWYTFKDGFWKKLDKNITMLKRRIIDDIIPIYNKMAKHYKMLSIQESNTEIVKKYLTTVDAIRKLESKLEDETFKRKVIEESRMYFFNYDLGHYFDENFDQNVNLIAFANGLYDLEKFEFREGRRDDMVSKHLVCKYKEYNNTSTHYKAIIKFFDQIFPDPELREYVLLFLSTALSGRQSESFHIFTGVGANGKSTLMDLMERTFGHNEDTGLACKIPVSLITRKRGDADNHSSSLAKTIGKRFVSIQEPENKDHLNMGLIKELTGKDLLQARKIYKEPVDFRPQYKMVMCCNDLPDVPYNDGGTWRRLKVIPFEAEFVDRPDPNNPNQFKKDENFGEYLNNPKTIEAFAFILITYYKKFIQEDNGVWKYPDKVNSATYEYRKKNDNFSKFMADRIQMEEGKSVRVSDVTRAFQIWFRANIGKDVPKSADLHSYIETTYRMKPKNRRYQGMYILEEEEDD